MAKPSLSNLPNELLHLVIENIDVPSRSALARTCRSLHAVTTPHLYSCAHIQKGKSNEFMRTISDKNEYSNLVHEVKVACEDFEISPCRIVPCLDKLQNLQSLAIIGGYWMWDTDKDNGTGEKWSTLERLLYDYLKKTSLEEPIGSRVSQNLRSLTMDRQEGNLDSAALHSSHAFIIPQLHTLKLRGFQIDSDDIEVKSEFERMTELKSLQIERSFVSFKALATALRAPSALQYLGIVHTEEYKHHELHSADSNNATMKEFMDILLLHRQSLEGIKIDFEEMTFGEWTSCHPPEINTASFLPYAKEFPKLKRWEGCDSYSMSVFLGGDSDASDLEAGTGTEEDSEGEFEVA
ncbi:unnamed protein product [Penicillium pancosmium]